MYEFCARYGVPHMKSGKLVVAHDEHEVRQLEALQQRGIENGVTGLEIVDRAFIVVARAGGEHEVRTLVARNRHRERRGVRQDAPAHRLGRRRHVSARHEAARRRPPRGRHGPHHRARIDSRRRGRQRRRAVRRRGVADAGRRDVHDLSVPRRVRGVHAGQADARQRARLPAAARLRSRTRRAPRADDRGTGLARTDDPVSGAQGRLRERPRTARVVRRIGAGA